MWRQPPRLSGQGEARPPHSKDVVKSPKRTAAELSSVMKTLKISAVATIAAMLAWWLGFAHKIWPTHPQLAVFLLALVICIVLQFTWPEPDKH